ncbi:uncharacterized protein MYCFIDRAFT_83266 [Pseudocercospora fijiensis CIRAD86]|uniref:F-box domain-containing protein n=1 Tax=Pseudocercospora fijiensis (strain CIRAD86) TaxID=383855 RepID=M2YHP9_PSEFD|nr:uncharacterized protein MYCFIDRAFT_83266 [Pseudocercospora fijiensis CIRAD86]EME77320.1 hypothetical protein MYCFIDRAFT_83266 [Pseudocercospora fijiensis CIRAD86]
MAKLCKHKCKDKRNCSHPVCCKQHLGLTPASTGPAPGPTSTPATASRRRRKAPASEAYVGPLRFLYEWPGAEEVINTNELLELVITFLAPHEIIRCRQVDRHWQAVIDNAESKEMRTALFLEAEPYNGKTVRADPEDAREGKLLLTDVFPNTALFQGVYKNKDSKNLEKLRFKYSPDTFSEDEPMLDMFLTQPPVRTMQGSWQFYKFSHPNGPREARLDKYSNNTNRWYREDGRWPFRNDRGLRYRDVVNYLNAFATKGLGEGYGTDLWRTFLFSRPETGIVVPRVPGWIKRRTETWEDDDAWRKFQKRHKRDWTAAERARQGLPPPSRKRKRKTEEEDEVEEVEEEQQVVAEDVEEDDFNEGD